MAVRIKSITFDCADPCRLAPFWLQLTGFSEDPGNGNAPDDPEALLLSRAAALRHRRACSGGCLRNCQGPAALLRSVRAAVSVAADRTGVTWSPGGHRDRSGRHRGRGVAVV